MQPNMHTLIALGTSVAYGYSAVAVLLMLVAPAALASVGGHQLHFDMAAIIVALILLGRWLESRALARTSGAIAMLMELRPQTAHLLSDDGSISDIPVDRVAAGDILAVRPGEYVPVDGAIAAGASSLDESALTGESMPADKSVGDPVFAGTLNGTGAFTLRAGRVGADTTLAQIIPPGGRSAGFRRAGAASRRPGSCLVRAGGGRHSNSGGYFVAVPGPGPFIPVRNPDAGGRAYHRLPLRPGAGYPNRHYRRRRAWGRTGHPDPKRRRAGTGSFRNRGCRR